MIRICVSLALVLLLAACSRNDGNELQGWVEADMIFVSPDEAGRVDMLNVREGDTVNQGAALFTVDPDIQQADVASAEAALANAQQAYDRAKQLLQSAAGTQRALDDADTALRTAQARLNPDAHPAQSPAHGEPGHRHGAADLLPAGRDRAGRAAGAVDPAAGEPQDPLLRRAGEAAVDQDR